MMAIQKNLVIAALALLTLPGVVTAQDNNQKEKEKQEGKEHQTIVITRTGDIDKKTIIEIDGDKVKVNGKEIKDSEGITVNVSSIKGSMFRSAAPNAWSFDLNGDNISLFKEDENRAMLGVITENHSKGAEIKSITEGTAAEKMGLQKGDVITKVGDKKIEGTGGVTEAIKSMKPGDKVDVYVLRDGKEVKKSGELGKWRGVRMNSVSIPRIDMQQFERFGEGFGATVWAPSRPKLGLSVQDTEDGTGVKVLEVEEESNAAKAGIQKNDIILSVDDIKIQGTSDISRAMRPKPEKFVYNFRISRNGKTQDIEVKMPKKIKTVDL